MSVDVWWHTSPCGTFVDFLPWQSLCSRIIPHTFNHLLLGPPLFVQPSSLRSSSLPPSLYFHFHRPPSYIVHLSSQSHSHTTSTSSCLPTCRPDSRHHRQCFFSIHHQVFCHHWQYNIKYKWLVTISYYCHLSTFLCAMKLLLCPQAVPEMIEVLDKMKAKWSITDHQRWIPSTSLVPFNGARTYVKNFSAKCSQNVQGRQCFLS